MPVHIPILRAGEAYESLETAAVTDPRSGQVLAEVSLANAGLIRRDLRRIGEAGAGLRQFSCEQLLSICREAGELFLHGELAVGDGSAKQSPQGYVQVLSATSGLPHVLCRKNMAKIHTSLTQMDAILRGLTRGLDLGVIDDGVGEAAGVPVSLITTTEAVGVILPSNSPGVNSIWLPAVALKMPVVLKPGRDEPWTPLRIIAALVAAGYPAEAIGFYPADHDGADAVASECGRSILFGDDTTMARYANNPNVQIHGTGRSKVVIGEDMIDAWPQLMDVLVSSVLDNGGRSCINASCIIAPRHGDEIAEALAARLGAVRPRKADDDEACLSAFTNDKFAQFIDGAIERGLSQEPGAEDVTARHRDGPRKVMFEGLTYLLPTIVRCGSFDHGLANTEFMFPYASVVQMSSAEALARMGPTLVATVITEDAELADRFVRCSSIDRLNLGPTPTSRVDWDQPHEGNLFEFLYRRRAISKVAV